MKGDAMAKKGKPKKKKRRGGGPGVVSPVHKGKPRRKKSGPK